MQDIIHPGCDSAPTLVAQPDLLHAFCWRVRLVQTALAKTPFAEGALELRLNSITYAELLDHLAAGVVEQRNLPYIYTLRDALLMRLRDLELIAAAITQTPQCSSLRSTSVH